jgi:DNA polymerase III alpha subunit
MAAFPAFSQAAREAGITPLYGMELDLLLRNDANAARLIQTVLLYARNSVGMSNLARLSARAYAKWPHAQEPITWETLIGHSDGLALVLPGTDGAGALSPFASAAIKVLEEWGSLLKERFGDAAFVGSPMRGTRVTTRVPSRCSSPPTVWPCLQ